MGIVPGSPTSRSGTGKEVCEGMGGSSAGGDDKAGGGRKLRRGGSTASLQNAAALATAQPTKALVTSTGTLVY